MDWLMSNDSVPLVLILGWGLQILSFGVGLARSGPSVRSRSSLRREFTLRGVLVLLVAASLAWKPENLLPLSSGLRVAAIALFLWAQLFVVLARWQLGPRWSIGIRPAVEAPPVRSGVYRVTSHPIYWGMGAVVACQALLLQNPPSLVLLVGAVAVLLFKARRETAWFNRLASDAGATTGEEPRSHG